MLNDLTEDRTEDLLYQMHHIMCEVSTRLELTQDDRDCLADCSDEILRIIRYVEENEGLLTESIEAQDRRDGQRAMYQAQRQQQS